MKSDAADMPIPPDSTSPETPPPYGTWPRLYGAVIGELVLLVFLFYLFRKAFE
jgi:hypothetical protein